MRGEVPKPPKHAPLAATLLFWVYVDLGIPDLVLQRTLDALAAVLMHQFREPVDFFVEIMPIQIEYLMYE